MKHTIELDQDTCDNICRESLKEAYRINSVPDKIDCSDEESWVDTEFLKALDLVMSYYCNAEEFRQWQQDKKEYDKWNKKSM